MSGHIKHAGVWKDLTELHIKHSGVWKPVTEGWAKNGGTWNQWWPVESGVTPGTYILSPSSLYLPFGPSGYAEYSTGAFLGANITGIWARISWRVATGLDNEALQVSGRPNSNFYRTINNDNNEWDGRTIDHRIDTFDATSLTDFSSGAAIGFGLQHVGPSNNLENTISNVQLVLEIS